jgi:hypothetical protein
MARCFKRTKFEFDKKYLPRSFPEIRKLGYQELCLMIRRQLSNSCRTLLSGSPESIILMTSTKVLNTPRLD